MKKVSKIRLGLVAFSALLLMVVTKAQAQTTEANKFQFSIGVETSDPTGNARLGSLFSLGGTARFQYGITNSFAVTLTSGAYHFFAKKIPGEDKRYDSYGVIPIKAGVKEFFVKNFYVGAEAGFAIEATDSGFGPDRFLLSPALGYANKHWDVAAHFERFSGDDDRYGLLALRIAYGFGL